MNFKGNLKGLWALKKKCNKAVNGHLHYVLWYNRAVRLRLACFAKIWFLFTGLKARKKLGTQISLARMHTDFDIDHVEETVAIVKFCKKRTMRIQQLHKQCSTIWGKTHSITSSFVMFFVVLVFIILSSASNDEQ